jgi:hypothetical protein
MSLSGSINAQKTSTIFGFLGRHAYNIRMQFENGDLESALNEFMRRGHARDAPAQNRDSPFHCLPYPRARDS